MTKPNCLIHKPRCGMQEGDIKCSKCGLDGQVRYVSQEAGETARTKALEAWTDAERVEDEASETQEKCRG